MTQQPTGFSCAAVCRLQLDAEIQMLMMQLLEAAEAAQQLHRIDGSEAPHRPQGAHQHLRCGDVAPLLTSAQVSRFRRVTALMSVRQQVTSDG